MHIIQNLCIGHVTLEHTVVWENLMLKIFVAGETLQKLKRMKYF